jgi:predicted GNAT superfamily acetyltransferase
MGNWILRILETAPEMEAVEALQRLVWPGSETEVVPAHMLIAAAHNGGLVIGAFKGQSQNGPSGNPPLLSGSERPLPGPLAGFVFGFPGLYFTPDGPRPKHCSHMLAVHPDYRSQGLGYILKRAQWQMVRHQGVDRITWTYDPLLSRNAYLNITRLGGVCNTYRKDEYGSLRDGLNAGLSTDRFQVDWWVNSKRVERRLSSQPRLQLDLAHFLAAGAEIANPTRVDERGFAQPKEDTAPLELSDPEGEGGRDEQRIILIEIPADFLALKSADIQLAHLWRLHTRELFEELFHAGYLVTDFIHLPGNHSRSFYVLSHGESTL